MDESLIKQINSSEEQKALYEDISAKYELALKESFWTSYTANSFVKDQEDNLSIDELQSKKDKILELKDQILKFKNQIDEKVNDLLKNARDDLSSVLDTWAINDKSLDIVQKVRDDIKNTESLKETNKDLGKTITWMNMYTRALTDLIREKNNQEKKS